jgi:hypothetical protein
MPAKVEYPSTPYHLWGEKERKQFRLFCETFGGPPVGLDEWQRRGVLPDNQGRYRVSPLPRYRAWRKNRGR